MGFPLKSRESLMNLAAFYCSKRETSRAWLGQYLRRKCRERDIPEPESREWIETILDTCEKSNMVNDQRYAGALVREYTRRGKGKRYIEQKLKEKGIRGDLGAFLHDENIDAEFLRAVALAEKIKNSFQTKVSRKAQRKAEKPQESKRFQRPTNEKFELKQKMIQKLVTSGFSINLSRKAVDQILADHF